ncbi:uncharacterized protein isoform X3 [Rhodnius prolixus]|uniref:uncharacterized protein isoform X3 n=1 Tax=Rhodnius prolixus TaxID=13249 RepID=UPI003D188C95
MKAKEVPSIYPSALFIATRGLKIPTDSDIAETRVADYEEMKRKLRNCQDEIYKLQAANSDLTQVNKRWHKYNSDMQIFIDKLQSTIRDQQEQINNIGEEQSYLHKREENNSTDCDRPKCRKLREEVMKLREEVEHLKFQVRAHKDDWEAEKLEKQEALNERDALQSRLNDVLRDICNLNRSQNDESMRRSQGCPCCKQWARSNVDYTVNSAGFHQTVVCSSSRQSPNHQGRYFFTDENIECDSSRQSTKLNCQNITEGEEKIRQRKLSTTSDDRTLLLEDTACSLRAREESYSTTTTLPSSSITHSRADSPIQQPPWQTTQPDSRQQQSTTLAMGIKTGNGATLTSYVRLPVVKSYSAPEGSLAGPSNVRLNSISLSVVPGNASNIAATSAAATVLQSHPPRSLPSLINQANNDEIACPHCQEIFTSGSHIDFLDHYEQCKKE